MNENKEYIRYNNGKSMFNKIQQLKIAGKLP